MLIATIIILLVAAALLVLAEPRPQLIRARRRQTPEELRASLRTERDRDIW
jgi:hypothetical protein